MCKLIHWTRICQRSLPPALHSLSAIWLFTQYTVVALLVDKQQNQTSRIQKLPELRQAQVKWICNKVELEQHSADLCVSTSCLKAAVGEICFLS